MLRLEQLTFTRFLAAISIVIFHYGRQTLPYTSEYFNFIFLKGYIGVSFFFILSGFIMIIAYGRKKEINFLDYLKNRIARIYPVYILALFIYVLFLLYKHKGVGSFDFFLNIFLFQSWVPGQALSLNSPGWSLSVEFLFYALFPFLYNKLYSKYKWQRLFFISITIWIVSQLLVNILVKSSFYQGFGSYSHDLIHYFPLGHINEFLVGNVLGLFFLKKRNLEFKNFDLHILVIVLLALLFLKFNTVIDLHNGFMGIFFVPLIYYFSINKGIISKIFVSKPLVFLGEASYGIYIFQKPIFIWSSMLLTNFGIESPMIRFYTFVILLIVISCIVYVLFEKPMRNIIKSFNLKRLTLRDITKP